MICSNFVKKAPGEIFMFLAGIVELPLRGIVELFLDSLDWKRFGLSDVNWEMNYFVILLCFGERFEWIARIVSRSRAVPVL